MRANESSRFTRVELLLGDKAVDRLANARVIVAGMGAVGSFAVESLARSGVGHLRLIDFDVITASNLNRQLFALESTLGRPKVKIASERVLDINPQCNVEALNIFIDEKTVGKILDARADVLIDAIDSVNPKATLIQAGVEAGIPVVSAMGAATRTDPSLIRVGDLSETEKCPLAKFMRKRLRKRGLESGVRCVYSLEPARNEPVDEEIDEERIIDRGRPRQPLGSLCSLPGIFGLTAAREALAVILGEL